MLALWLLEKAPARTANTIRGWLWKRRIYFVVHDGPSLIAGALRRSPETVRALCANALVRRYDDRAGGGFWPDTSHIWLAAGIETYESHAQVFNSARHELFHYVCWNHADYRRDEERGFTALLEALREAKPIAATHERYAAWVRSFLRQGDHANVVEYFADIPTNFTSLAELPSPLARHFAPLVEGGPIPASLRGNLPATELELAEFQRLVSPDPA